jgi:hypothetical protein
MAAAPNSGQVLKERLAEALAPVLTTLAALQVSVEANAQTQRAIQAQLADIVLAIETKATAKRAVKVNDAVVAGDAAAAGDSAAASGAAAAASTSTRKAKAAEMSASEAAGHIPTNKRLWVIHCGKYDLFGFREKYCTEELIQRGCVALNAKNKSINAAKTFQNISPDQKHTADWYKAAIAVVYDGVLTDEEKNEIENLYKAQREKEKQHKQSAAEPLAPDAVQDTLDLTQ